MQLRPRGGWEALDLGFQMARAWWRPVWGAWLVVYLPLAAALHIAFSNRLWIALLVLWWLKPAFDRFVLHVISRAVFGAAPTVNETVAAWRDLLRPGLLSGLTIYRLHPSRAAVLPVWQLEKQTGGDGRQRRRVLTRRMTGKWAAISMCGAFEAVMFFSLGVFATLLAPAGAETPFELTDLFRGQSPGWEWEWFDSVCYIAAVSIVEPLYVAAGFSLYLNRRAVLEGWDIELQLRRLDERLRAAHAGFAAMLVLACVLVLAPSPGAVAAEPSAKEAIQEVLKAPEFEQHRDTTRWKYRGEREPQERPPSDFWRGLGVLLADVAQAVLWIAVGLGVIALLLIARRYLPRWVAEKAEDYRPPDTMFGLAVTPESLPGDVAGTAAALAQAGRLREALSLLYRGALSVLVHRDHVPLAEGDTEGDCVRAARKALPQTGADYFDRLVKAWTAAAYADRLVDAAAAESLAREWPPHFAAAPQAGT